MEANPNSSVSGVATLQEKDRQAAKGISDRTNKTHITSTTATMIPVCLSPSPKNAGAADPVLKARTLKFAENQTKNI